MPERKTEEGHCDGGFVQNHCHALRVEEEKSRRSEEQNRG
jgi:hypothetical protein